jgi:NAD-dependent DNA ligase
VSEVQQTTLAALRFIYCNVGGEVSERSLTQWFEAGHYVKGHDVTKGKVLTFRKDRVREYLDGCETLLKSPSAPPPPKPASHTEPESRPQILFTGYGAAQRKTLEAQASEAGLAIVSTVTKGLTFLACGPNAGPAKIEKARTQGVYIVSDQHLQSLLQTGELLDELPEVG